MNFVDTIIRFYGLLLGGGRWLSPLRIVVRIIADYFIPIALRNEREKEIVLEKPIIVGKRKLIVSFTSFPARIDKVWMVVKCMERQTVKPDKVILWLSKEQFKNKLLPVSLTSLIDDLFEIRFVDNNYRSHKKYCYAFKEYSNDLVILVDDDIYYHSTMIEDLLKGLEAHPNSIICQYGSEMKYNTDGSIPPFSSWWKEQRRASDSLNFFLGTGGGSLFQPSKLIDTVLDTKLAISLTPMADDIWVNAMIRLSGLSIFKIKCGLLLQMTESQKAALKQRNSYEGGNDEQFENIIKYFINERNINPFINREL